MNCILETCSKTAQKGHRLCPDHVALGEAMGISVPSTGRLSAKARADLKRIAVSASVRAAVSVKARDDLKRIAGSASVRAAVPELTEGPEVGLPAPLTYEDGVRAGQDQAAKALMAALERREWDIPDLTNNLNLALSVAIAMATSDEQGSALLKAAQGQLDQLGAPDGQLRDDGTLDARVATRIGLLIRFWQETIRGALPERVDGAGCEGGPLEVTLAEIRQGLALVEEGQERLHQANDAAVEAEEDARQAQQELGERLSRAHQLLREMAGTETGLQLLLRRQMHPEAPTESLLRALVDGAIGPEPLSF